MTLLRGSCKQQQADYLPGNFDGFFLYDKNANGKNFVEVNQGVSLGIGIVSRGVSREFRGKSSGYEDLKNEFSGALGPLSGSGTYNEKGQLTDRKINLAKGKIAFGIGVEIKVSTGYTSDKF